MDSPTLVLFHLLRERLTEKDIQDFSPADPGYDSYVKLWTTIFATGKMPCESEFDLDEVIGLTGWFPADEATNPDRFRIYRLFTSSVACGLYLTDIEFGSRRPLNYTLVRLINDAFDLGDRDIHSSIGDVLVELKVSLKQQRYLDEEAPFLDAAEMIWAQRIGDFQRSESSAEALILEEHLVRKQMGDHFWGGTKFLFGLTISDLLNSEWNDAFAKLTNPNNHEETQLVIDALTEKLG